MAGTLLAGMGTLFLAGHFAGLPLSRVILMTALSVGLAAALGWQARRWFLDSEDALREGEAAVKRAEQAKQLALDQLQAAHDELETFSYSVSHDLRAPLRSMAGFAEILSDEHGASLDGDARGYLVRIRDAARRMGERVDGLLLLSRLNRQPLELEELDLSAMALELGRQAAALHLPREVDFSVEEGLRGRGDARLVRTALQNLIENAFKFSVRVDRPRVEFARMDQAAGRAFVVRDNGAGFDMAYSDRLFQAFQRLHSDKDFSGTGIGLATAARALRRQGGRIWAESRPGEGAAFYFTLEPE